MKRIIAIMLCLCIILAGCQNKKNDNLEPTPGAQKPTESISTNNNGSNRDDTATQLLHLNEAWSLIQTVELSKEDYEVPNYETKVDDYYVAADLSNIENQNQFEGFTKEQIKMLVQNGFVVLPSKDTRAYYVYDDNEYKGVPNFITSDSVLHLYHQFYDKSLMSIESNYLYNDLELMTKQMLDKSILLLEQLTDEDLKKIQEKNIVYFLVSRMLMLQSPNIPVTVDEKLIELAKQEYKLIQSAAGVTKSPLFEFNLDYSQFTVRGHYTRSEELGKYFKTMMWFGYAPIPFLNKKEIQYDNLMQSLLITYMTIADSESTCDAELWSNIYQPTAQYVGLSDDVNVFTLNGLRSFVFGENEDPNSYNDPEYRDKLTEAVLKLPGPQIQAELINSDMPTEKQFRFMGQRYVLDSEIMQNLMKPILRPLPSSLDVMGVMGSNTAENLLFNYYKPQVQWPDYTNKYQELENRVAGYDKDYWETNLYTGWLWSLQDVLTDYDDQSGMPFFMTTDAWRYKSLNAALGSYAELKHDTVLYGKQAMAEMGGPTAFAELHYVEPNVPLYSKLLYLTDLTCKILEDKGMLNQYLKDASDSYKKVLNLLIKCSLKELNNEPLTEEENKQLLWYGGTMESIMLSVQMGATGDMSVKDASDMLVTDVATCDGRYLSLATGYFDYIYVVIPYERKLYLSRGTVYSFYEFNSQERLTDEAWWALQGINVIHEEFGDYLDLSEPSEKLPKQPEWTLNFKSEKNNVTITPLEVVWGNLEE